MFLFSLNTLNQANDFDEACESLEVVLSFLSLLYSW